MYWILIVLALGDGSFVHHVQFADEKSCLYAKEQVLVLNNSGWTTFRATCVPFQR